MSENVMTLPIRLLFGIGNNMFQGFSAVYEEADGSSGTINIWFPTLDDPNTASKLIKFVDAPEESCIIWRKVEKTAGFFGNKTQVIWRVAEIRLRRDWQIKS